MAMPVWIWIIIANLLTDISAMLDRTGWILSEYSSHVCRRHWWHWWMDTRGGVTKHRTARKDSIRRVWQIPYASMPVINFL